MTPDRVLTTLYADNGSIIFCDVFPGPPAPIYVAPVGRFEHVATVTLPGEVPERRYERAR